MKRHRVFILLLAVLSLSTLFLTLSFFSKYKAATYEENFNQYKKLSNCVLPIKVMEKALKTDVTARKKGKSIKFTALVSLLASKYYGDWEKYKEKDLEELVERFLKGETKEELSELYSNFSHFENFYDALFSEFVGEYKISKAIEYENEKDLVFEKKYVLKAYSPIAYGYDSSFCDDFDNEINLAKQKGHFGNDIAAKKGTPFVAVESGVISKISEDDGIFTIELKSLDGRRTYIYSNCNEKEPFAKGLKEGDRVLGGDLLGFVGSSNCCKKGGAKILNCPYLHFALKLNIKTGEKEREIYVDTYNILKFLEHHKSAFKKGEDGLFRRHIFKEVEIF